MLSIVNNTPTLSNNSSILVHEHHIHSGEDGVFVPLFGLEPCFLKVKLLYLDLFLSEDRLSSFSNTFVIFSLLSNDILS